MPDYLTYLNSFFRGMRGGTPKFLSRAGNALPQAIRATLKRFFPENVLLKHNVSGNVLIKEEEAKAGPFTIAGPHTITLKVIVPLSCHERRNFDGHPSPDECRFCNPPEEPRYSEYENRPEFWWTTCPLHGQVFRKNTKIKFIETFPGSYPCIRPVPIVPGNVKYTYGPIEYTYPPSWFRIRTGV